MKNSRQESAEKPTEVLGYEVKPDDIENLVLRRVMEQRLADDELIFERSSDGDEIFACGKHADYSEHVCGKCVKCVKDKEKTVYGGSIGSRLARNPNLLEEARNRWPNHE
jgi:hypothetical protein